MNIREILNKILEFITGQKGPSLKSLEKKGTKINNQIKASEKAEKLLERKCDRLEKRLKRKGEDPEMSTEMKELQKDLKDQKEITHKLNEDKLANQSLILEKQTKKNNKQAEKIEKKLEKTSENFNEQLETMNNRMDKFFELLNKSQSINQSKRNLRKKRPQKKVSRNKGLKPG